MRDFLFKPEQARTPLGKLSGGERGRLMLAQVLARPSNLLVLDEPTNDLDMETLDVLEGMVGDYGGTVLLISHDRDFLDRLVGSVIVPEGNGRWIEYAGGYTDMLAQRGADLTREQRKPAAAKPAREAKPAPQAPARKRRCRPKGARCSSSWTIRHSMPATAPHSSVSRPRLARCRPGSPKRRIAGWNWKSSARSSAASKHRSPARDGCRAL
jgi:ABC-type multidrug transport system ATPase subunit